MARLTKGRSRGGGAAAADPQQPSTTTAKAPPPTHSEWRHGPVAAAINAAIGMMAAAVAGRLAHAHTQPVWALVAGFTFAAALLFAGRMRTVVAGGEQVRRPLSTRSVVYRFTAMATAGVWLWVQLADFSHVDLVALGPALVFTAVGGALLLAVAILFRAGQARFAVLAMFLAGPVVTFAGWKLIHATGTGIFFTTAPVTSHTILAWEWEAGLTLVGLAVLYGIFGAACANHELNGDAAQVRTLLARSGSAARLYMQLMLRDLTRNPNLEVTAGPTPWTNGAGQDYIVDGSTDGVTADDLGAAHIKNAVAARLRLKPGCGVEMVPGEHRGLTILSVSLVNKIKDDHRYPMDRVTPRSIYNPIPVGVLRDGTEVGPTLRENSLFVWGQKRSGKTTTLFDLMAGINQCTDALIWVIDLGGGGAAAEFIYAAAAGRCNRPGVDWVATTLHEAALMADALYNIAVTRKKVYQWRKRLADTNLLPLDAEVPQVFVVIDEGAELMGERVTRGDEGFLAGKVRDRLEACIRIGGDSGTGVVLSGLRAVADVVDPGVLAQMGARIGMRVSETRELAYGFGQDYSLNPADVPYQGSGFIEVGPGSTPRVFKAYQITPSGIHDLTVRTADWQPVLDFHSRRAAGPAYAQRWDRTWQLIQDEHGNPVLSGPPAHWDPVPAGPVLPPGSTGGPVAVDADPAPPAADPPLPPVGPPPPATGDVNVADAVRPPEFTDFRSAEQTLRDADAVMNELGFTPTGDTDFDELMAGAWAAPPALRGRVDLTNLPPAPKPAHLEERDNPTGRQVLEELVRQAGPAGLTMKDICVRLTTGGSWGDPVEVSRQTVDAWLKAARHPEPGEPDSPARWLAKRSGRQPYIHRDNASGG